MQEIERIKNGWKQFRVCCSEDFAKLIDHIDNLEAENERLRMQVVACGVVAMADTPASSVEARNMHPDYKSASCDDVARRVDECITLRAEVERLRKDAERLDFLDINQHWRMGWTVGRSPVGNISVKAVVQLDGATTSIREAIDAAMKGTP